jgi:uncharacterized protein YlxP (DUF503 family)
MSDDLAITNLQEVIYTIMSLGLLTLHIHLPGCQSLKDKRSRLKPLLARLHREFNISVAEIDHQDLWQDAVIACAIVSNDNGFTQRSLCKVVDWLENSRLDIDLINEHLEIM